MCTKSVAGIIFSHHRSQVLLILRRDVPVWVLPGGGVEPGESPEAAVIREIMEETGFNVKVTRLVGIYTPINRLARLTHLYECDILSGEAISTNETKEACFFPIDALPLMPPPYSDWVKEAQIVQPIIYRHLNDVTYGQFIKNLFFHPVLVIRFLLSRLGFPINS